MATGSASAPACNTTDTESARNASSGNTGASFVTWDSSAATSACVRWIGWPLTGPVESPEHPPSSTVMPARPQTSEILMVTSSGWEIGARIGSDRGSEEPILCPGEEFRENLAGGGAKGGKGQPLGPLGPPPPLRTRS